MVSIPGGEAESRDGLNWTLYVMHDSIIAHTGLSEVRFGIWNVRHGLDRARIRGTARTSLIESIGHQLVDALEIHAAAAPFAPADHYECWMLSDSGAPLALIDSCVQEAEIVLHDHPIWLAGSKAQQQFKSAHGTIDELTAMVNQAAGKKPLCRWFQRDMQQTNSSQFPALMLSTNWLDASIVALIDDFLHWQAPWLLQLPLPDNSYRARFEQHCWQQPLAAAECYRLFPEVLDTDGLRIARVKAGLLEGSRGTSVKTHEPFYRANNDEKGYCI